MYEVCELQCFLQPGSSACRNRRSTYISTYIIYITSSTIHLCVNFTICSMYRSVGAVAISLSFGAVIRCFFLLFFLYLLCSFFFF